MANITAKMVQELREKTGAGMLDCKKALTDAEGDMDKAVKILREKGLAAAANRSGKQTAEGIVKIKSSDKRAVIVEVNSETDFVAKNENFLKFADDIVDIIFTNKPADLNALKNCKFGNTTVAEELTQFIAKIGENIQIRRFDIIESNQDEIIGQYIHAGGKIGVLLKLQLSDISKKETGDVKELLKDLCMQVAAAEPKYISSKDVTQEDLDNERAVYTQQMRNEGKPEKIIANIVEGKIKKYYELVCLEDQLFIKDQNIKVNKVIEEVSKKSGISIKVTQFVRYKVGEGIEKKKVDFAAEVQAQLSASSK